MRRRLLLVLGLAFGLVVLAYGVLSGYARGPLSVTEFWTFAAAVARATPSHPSGGNVLETLRLGGRAFGSPAEAAVLSVAEHVHTVPLPPHTARTAADTHAPRFVTFATADQLHDYLHSTLAQAGWRYREQLGSMHAIERDDLVLSVSIKLHTGTRVRELSVTLQRRSDRAG